LCFKNDLKGSSILDVLYEKILQYSGDQKLQELVYFLAQSASKSYLNMLDNWIHKGIIKDPYDEFMIAEKKDGNNNLTGRNDILSDQYWENRYTIKPQNVPIFLKEFQERILFTGKYLNAINITVKIQTQNSSNKNPKNNSIKQYEVKQENQEILFSMKHEHYKEIIDKAYDYSNKLLLDLLLNEFKLIMRLKSLKHYFLLDQSDFMVHFMDISEEEMSKSVATIKPSRLESLLELSLRITSANSDPYKDDLKVKLFPTDLRTFLDSVLMIGTLNGKL
jgi:gamma-tubulin complex component 2